MTLLEFWDTLFPRPRLFVALSGVAAVFIVAYFWPFALPVARLGLGALILLAVVDGWMLYRFREGLAGEREVSDRLSNGDSNPIVLHFASRYTFPLQIDIIDELPFQFQKRDIGFSLRLPPGERKSLTYQLRPVVRGAYQFGKINVFARASIGLFERRYRFAAETEVAVYPSYQQVRRYQIMALSHRLNELGVKRVRRLGHTTEFEQIKSYVRGDDYRTLNWKATARTGRLMVNQYADERAQHVYCLIDKSRSMRMPFKGLSLLDYAINASLVLAHIALYRHDKTGLLTFAQQLDTFLPASGQQIQMRYFQDALYRQETEFLEADYGKLYSSIRRQISHRSLLLLFTNFLSHNALRRNLPYLKRIARQHRLLVIFFKNTELHELLQERPRDVPEIYLKATAEQLEAQQQLIARELTHNGILTLRSTPAQLTVNALNQYLAIKARQG